MMKMMKMRNKRGSTPTCFILQFMIAAKTMTMEKVGDQVQHQQIPLQRFVHVVKLQSENSPREYLKCLNIPSWPETLKIGRQNTPKTTNKITDGFFDSRVLSRNHAELFVRDNELFIRDLKSSNGTFINDVKLEPFKDYPLVIGDKVDLGTTLESQMAHKKITCIVGEIDFIDLNVYNNIVKDIVDKDWLESKKLELFNTPFDALLFGDMGNVSGTYDDNLLLHLIGDQPHVEEERPQFINGLDITPSKTMGDVVNKLIIAVNNEHIQQQRLKALAKFIRNYNNGLTINKHNGFSKFDELLNPHQSQEVNKVNELERKVKALKHELDLGRTSLSNYKYQEREFNALKTKEMENQKLYQSQLETVKKESVAQSAKIESLNRELQLKTKEIKKIQQSMDDKHSELDETQDDLKRTLALLNTKEKLLQEVQSKLTLIQSRLETKESTIIELMEKQQNSDSHSSNMPLIAGLAIGSMVAIASVKLFN